MLGEPKVQHAGWVFGGEQLLHTKGLIAGGNFYKKIEKIEENLPVFFKIFLGFNLKQLLQNKGRPRHHARHRHRTGRDADRRPATGAEQGSPLAGNDHKIPNSSALRISGL